MISTKGRYALVMMVDLAEHDSGAPVSIREISERQGISGKYLEQIISTLIRAALVKSIRGAQGGYHLAIPAEQITVGMILRATEGDMAPTECCYSGACCERSGACSSQHLFKRVYTAINEVIDHVTLAELMAEDMESRCCSPSA
ncbi:MAG: Rrf2 family transcriptional regulator [Clostridia bacterium]|nr:Rrf2 family transcriptional regulator [Clostridia bacterium]